MVAVHDGTPNINSRNVINVKCVNCKNCIGFEEGFYICELEEGISFIEECIANDDNQKCDLYDNDDRNDDFTERA